MVKDQVDAAVLARTIRYAVQRKRVQTAERTLRDGRLPADMSKPPSSAARRQR